MESPPHENQTQNPSDCDAFIRGSQELETGAMEDRIGSEDMEFLDFLSALLGRAEIERLVALRRNVCELKERSNHRKDAVNTFDRGNGLEKVLEMVECLPQGSRGTQPPHEGFLELGKEVAGRQADSSQTLAVGLVLEEYAIQLLESRNTTRNLGEGERPAAWAVACSGVPHHKLMAAERESLESCPTAAQFAQVVHEIVVCDGEPNNAIRRPRKRRRKVAPPQIGNLESPASLVENESDHVGNTEGGHENVKRSEPQGYYSSDFYESDDAD